MNKFSVGQSVLVLVATNGTMFVHQGIVVGPVDGHMYGVRIHPSSLFQTGYTYVFQEHRLVPIPEGATEDQVKALTSIVTSNTRTGV